ncbi:MAG: hypothetical protein NTZ14_00400 [Hyphomicrobiales bacterium]|nr:hypothetical protein [Hyphomicrobiales bacterium]
MSVSLRKTQFQATWRKALTDAQFAKMPALLAKYGLDQMKSKLADKALHETRSRGRSLVSLYSVVRRHSTIGYLSQVEFERKV